MLLVVRPGTPSSVHAPFVAMPGAPNVVLVHGKPRTNSEELLSRNALVSKSTVIRHKLASSPLKLYSGFVCFLIVFVDASRPDITAERKNENVETTIQVLQ